MLLDCLCRRHTFKIKPQDRTWQLLKSTTDKRQNRKTRENLESPTQAWYFKMELHYFIGAPFFTCLHLTKASPRNSSSFPRNYESIEALVTVREPPRFHSPKTVPFPTFQGFKTAAFPTFQGFNIRSTIGTVLGLGIIVHILYRLKALDPRSLGIISSDYSSTVNQE